jgi:hypothetical protein
MYCPILHENVRLSHHTHNFTVMRVDYTACVVDLHSPTDNEAIRKDVPFRMLFAAPRITSSQPPPTWQDCVATTREIVLSTRIRVAASALQLVDAEHSLRVTCDVIRQSRLAIQASDRIIARVQNLYLEDLAPTRASLA